jgi:hypothetical protein
MKPYSGGHLLQLSVTECLDPQGKRISQHLCVGVESRQPKKRKKNTKHLKKNCGLCEKRVNTRMPKEIVWNLSQTLRKSCFQGTSVLFLFSLSIVTLKNNCNKNLKFFVQNKVRRLSKLTSLPPEVGDLLKHQS